MKLPRCSSALKRHTAADPLPCLDRRKTRSCTVAVVALLFCAFEGTSFGLPSLVGTYKGRCIDYVRDCPDSGDYKLTTVLTVTKQSGASFVASAVGTIKLDGSTYSEYTMFEGEIAASGQITGTSTHTFLDTGGKGTFTGKLTGSKLQITNSGHDTYGGSCAYTRKFALQAQNPKPEITVQQPSGTNLKDGVSTKSFGRVPVKSHVSKTFTIRNTGKTTLKNLVVTKAGPGARNFIVKPPLKNSLPPNSRTTFKVKFRPSTQGDHSAVIRIASNDSDENPFDIAVTGVGETRSKASANPMASFWNTDKP